MSDYTIAQKGKMKEHVDSVHEKKNPNVKYVTKRFKFEILAKNFFLKHYLKVHVTSIHGKNKQSYVFLQNH